MLKIKSEALDEVNQAIICLEILDSAVQSCYRQEDNNLKQ
jgi:hypothetical protein